MNSHLSNTDHNSKTVHVAIYDRINGGDSTDISYESRIRDRYPTISKNIQCQHFKF
jgi:L-2-hydroxyglutarate oxidase LhgO